MIEFVIVRWTVCTGMEGKQGVYLNPRTIRE